MKTLHLPNGVRRNVGEIDGELKKGPPCPAKYFRQDVVCGETKSPHFCKPKAERMRLLFARGLVLTKGEQRQRPFLPMEWQANMINAVYGINIYSEKWERWVRRCRHAAVHIQRKNGKTELVAGLAMCHLFAGEDEEIWIGAQSRTAASSLIGEHIYRMWKHSPGPQRAGVTHQKTAQTYRCEGRENTLEYLLADMEERRGFNPSLMCIDELLAVKDAARQISIAKGAFLGRPEHLLITTSTAAWELENYERVLADQIRPLIKFPDKDPSTFPFIFEAAPDDDPHEPKIWQIANPGWGVTVIPEEFHAGYLQAVGNVLSFQKWRAEHLGQVDEGLEAFIPLNLWDECDGEEHGYMDAAEIYEALLRCDKVVGGIDLSYASDMTSLVIIGIDANGILLICQWSWLPADIEDEFVELLNGLPAAWIDSGELELMRSSHSSVDKGWVTISEVAGEMNRILQPFVDAGNLEAVGYDKYSARSAMEQWVQLGLPIVDVPQRTALHASLEELLARTRAGTIAHGGSEVMAYCIRCMVVKEDKTGRQLMEKPKKKTSRMRVDAVSALLTALYAYFDPGVLDEPATAGAIISMTSLDLKV